jgi:UDP-N-acetylglucosamine--N-acetylmuramyl-(pentapeptide) pyrophosphoryl-undecaprenol N-acetylglucosamine transferase
METKKKKIYLVAGGTGGHISPAIALAENLSKNGFAPVLITAKRDLRFSFLQDLGEAGIGHYTYEAPKFNKNPLKILMFLKNFYKALALVGKWLQKDQPIAIIGFGGYVSAPVLWKAGKGIPIFLCEQNSYLGLVNRLFLKKSRRVFLSFPLVNQRISANQVQKKFLLYGNPIREQASPQGILNEAPKYQKLRKEAFTRYFINNHLGISRENKAKINKMDTLLIFGGSQGAEFLNQWAVNFIKNHSKVKVILICGSEKTESLETLLSDFIPETRARISLIGFETDMRPLYALADLAVARAGGSLFELAAWEIPTVQVPYPFAADNHQLYNAQYFQKNFNFEIFEQSLGQQKLSEMIQNFMNNIPLRQNIKALLHEKKFDKAGLEITLELCRFLNVGKK